MKKLLFAATVLTPLLAHAQTPTPTLPQDITSLGQQITSLNDALTQLLGLPKSPKTLAAIITELQGVNAGLHTLSSNLSALLPPPPPPPAACVGTPIVPPATAALIMPPAVPQPVTPADIVGVKLQNFGTATSPAYITFGQVFKQGQVQPTDGLANAQMDVEALWPDGSVKMAAITIPANICAGSETPMLLTKAASSGAPLVMPSVALTVALTFASGTQTIDLGSMIRTSTDMWQKGPMAVQARVDAPVTGQPSLHITGDVTAYADGSVLADVQFGNDLTTLGTTVNPPALPALVYTPSIILNGKTTALPQVTQYQYQDWHAQVGAVGSVNVQHDAAYLEATGAVLKYDLMAGVQNGQVPPGSIWPPNVFDGANTELASTGFGTPLAVNGLDQFMPDTGGRGDIGWTTVSNTAWILTGDWRVAQVALAQGDTSGAVGWAYKNAANGHWFTTLDNPQIWIDYRSSIMLANSGSALTGWTPERAHAPNLNYVPYLMTAERRRLDLLNAQAAFDVTTMNADPTYGRCSAAGCDIVMTPYGQQVRGMAWSMREIGDAAFIGKAGSWEQSYFAAVRDHNWAYAATQEPAMANEGEATGWWPRIDNWAAGAHVLPWEQSYLSGVAAQQAAMGVPGAKAFVQWQHGWLTGLFNAPSPWNPRDGCTYNIVAFTSVAPIALLTTWGAMEAATVAEGSSQGIPPAPWPNGNGDYCSIARGTLGAALAVTPGDAGLTQALAWLNANGPYSVTKTYFQQDPTFDVVPP